MSSKDVKSLKNDLKKYDRNQLMIRDKNSNNLINKKNKKIKNLEYEIAELKKELANKTTKLRNEKQGLKKLKVYRRCLEGEIKCRVVAMKRKIVETTTTTTTTTTKSYEEDLQFLNYNF
jgi:hypothetical protein